MSCAYRVHSLNGDCYVIRCAPIQLKKIVAGKFNNIPMDQIILIDNENKLFNNSTQTQMHNSSTEQTFTLLDLQKLINEWSMLKIENYSQKKTIDGYLIQIQGLMGQIETQSQELQNNLQDRNILNEKINKLKENLQILEEQSREEKYKIENQNQILQSQILANATSYEQKQKQSENSISEINQKLKTAENQQLTLAAQIQQLTAQIQEKENTIKNINYQNSQQQQLIQQQWQEYFNNCQYQVQLQNQKYQTQIDELTTQKESLEQKLKAEQKKQNQTQAQTITDLETQLSTASALNKTKDANIKKLQQQIDQTKEELENLQSEKNKFAQVGQNVNQEVQKLKSELSKLKTEYTQLQFEKEKLQQDSNAFKQQHEAFANQAQGQIQIINKQHEEEVKSLNNKILFNENQLNETQTINRQQQIEINELKQQKENIIKELENLKKEKIIVADLGQNISFEAQQMKQQLIKLKSNYENLQSEKEKVENELNGSQQQHILDVKQAQTTLKKTIQEHQQAVETLNDKIELLENEINNLKNQLSLAEQVIKERDAQIVAANQENSKLQQNLFNANWNSNTIIQLQDQLEQNNKQFSQERLILQKTIQDLQSQLSSNTTSFENQLLQLQNEKQDLQEKLKLAEKNVEQKETSIQQLNDQISEKEKEIETITFQNQQQYLQLQQQWQQYFNNYQQQVTIQNQAYEESINELAEEKESLERKLKAEQKKANQTLTETINDYETQLTQAKGQNKMLQEKVKKLYQQIEQLKEDLEKLESQSDRKGLDVNQEVQKLKQDLQKLKNENSQLYNEREQLQNDFDTFKQQHVAFAKQAENSLITTNQEHDEEVKSLNDKINQLNNDINNFKKQLSDAHYQIKDREIIIENAQKEIKKLIQLQEDLNSSGNHQDKEKKKLESQIKQLQDELNEARNLYDAEKTKHRAAESEKTQLKGHLQQKDIELHSEKSNHEATRREKDQYQEQCRKMANSFNEIQKQTSNEAQRLQRQVSVADKKIERVLQNYVETKIFEKITGPLQKIMASEFKINKFTQDPNSQTDNPQYNLIEITLQFDKYTQYVKEGKFFLIDECFQYGDKINITAIRSIQANAESEFYKGYLIKIIESKQADLKTKTLLRKDFKLQNQASENKEEPFRLLARLAANNIFCQWLQMQFNKDLTIAKLQSQKQTIQRQFIIENEAKKEFYYCEMVEEGVYSKINGGKFVPQKDDIHQYFNALSLYSYKMFEQQLILTNFQVCGNYVYDMIVHTNHKGLFSPLDQDPHESMTFTEILGKQPADIISKSWNETVKSQAEKYLIG